MAATIESASGLGTDAEARLGVALSLVGLAVLVSEMKVRLPVERFTFNPVDTEYNSTIKWVVTKNDKQRQFDGYAREGNPVVNEGRE